MDHPQLTRRSLLMTMGMGALSLCGCGTPAAMLKGDEHRVVMVTNTGGINDQGFNELSWSGLQYLRDNEGYVVSYIESKQDADYVTNLDKAIDFGSSFVWSVGFDMGEATYLTARINPELDVNFGIIDSVTNGNPKVTGVLFANEEPSFIVGYVAGKTTKTNKVGFVGGIESDNIYSFEYGYLGGVAYAAHERGVQINVDSQYAESFTDSAKGRSIAQKMFSSGIDIVYHAAGGVGVGVIEAAKETKNFAIGVDMDQSFLAPENVLTSALKRVDRALIDLTPKLISGEIAGGSDVVLRLRDGDFLGIPEDHHLMPEGVYEDALQIMKRIQNEEIVPPPSETAYEQFLATLA